MHRLFLGLVWIAGACAVAPPATHSGLAGVIVHDTAGAPLAGFTTIWHDTAGNVLAVVETGEDGVAAFEVEGSAMVTAVYSFVEPYHLATLGEINPGDIWTIEYLPPVTFTATMTFTLPALPGTSFYQLDNGCLLTRSSAFGGTLHMWESCVTDVDTFHTLATAITDDQVNAHLLIPSVPVPVGNPGDYTVAGPWVTESTTIPLSVTHARGTEVGAGIADAMVEYDGMWFRLYGQFYGTDASVPPIGGLRVGLGAEHDVSTTVLEREYLFLPPTIALDVSEDLLEPITALDVSEIDGRLHIAIRHANDPSAFDTVHVLVRTDTHIWTALTRARGNELVLPALPEELDSLVPTFADAFTEVRLVDRPEYRGWADLRASLDAGFMLQRSVPFVPGNRVVVAGVPYRVPRP